MERARLDFTDHLHPALSGTLLLSDEGRVSITVSPALAKALASAVSLPSLELGPLRFDDARRGLALAAALAKGVSATLLEFEFAAGAFEVRAYFGGGRVRLSLTPGDFDPDEAWQFLLAANDAVLDAPRP